MSNTNKFLHVYTKLEYVATKYYNKKYEQGNSPIYDVSHDKQFNSKEVDYCRNIRNLIIHKYFSMVIEPTNEMVEYLEKIIKILEYPKKLKDIYIPFNKLYTANFDDNISIIMKKMKTKAYTNIPIMENGLVIGVFSENTLFEYIGDNKIASIGKNTLVSEFKDYLSIKKHINEKFLFYKYDTTMYEIKQIFESNFQKGKRIEMVFITQSGKETEKLLGIITPWDLINIK